MASAYSNAGRIPESTREKYAQAVLAFYGVLDLIGAEYEPRMWKAGGVGDQPAVLWEVLTIVRGELINAENRRRKIGKNNSRH